LTVPLFENSRTNNLPDTIRTDEWTKTFGNGRLGYLKTGDLLEESLQHLEVEFNIEFDSIPACHDCEEYEYYYQISTRENLHIFTLYPGQSPEDNHLVFRIDLFDPSYKSDKGIGVGDTVGGLKEKYKIIETYFNYHDGLQLVVEGFYGSFVLDAETYSGDPKYNFEDPTPDNVPDDSVIGRIVIL